MSNSIRKVNMPIADESTYYTNFDAEFRDFWNDSNFHCILAGLGYEPERPLPELEYRAEDVAAAEDVFARIRAEQQEIKEKAPTCYAYLSMLHGRSEAA